AARGLRQSPQKLLVTRARVAPHNRAHRRIRLQPRCINRDPLPLQQPAIGQHPQHPTEYFTMRIEVDQSSRARDRRVVRRVLVQRNAHKAPQRQRVRQPPGNPPLRPDTLEIPDQQRSKVNPRRQRRTPVLLRIKLRAPLLDELVEALGLQQLIQALIKRMSRSRRQLAVRDPDVLLLLPLLARPHRHAPILRTKSVDTAKVFAYESGLSPRSAREHAPCQIFEPVCSLLEFASARVCEHSDYSNTPNDLRPCVYSLWYANEMRVNIGLLRITDEMAGIQAWKGKCGYANRA